MNKLFILFFLSFFAISVYAKEISSEEEKQARKEYPTETLYNIWIDYKKDEQSLSHFYNSLPEKHIVELDKNNPKKASVTYFAKGGQNTDYILQSGGPDFFGLRFKQIGNSHYYFCTQNIPSDAMFSYGVNEFKRIKSTKIRGTNQTSMEHIYDGSIVAQDAPLSPHIQMSPNVPKGERREVTINSKFMGEERKLVVYVPAAYNNKVAHNLVIQLDGQNYSRNANHGPIWQGWTPMPTILDNLIFNKEITPTIAVMVFNHGSRSKDMLNEEFTKFIALEVITWARENFTIGDASQVIVSGPSRAGFAATNTALNFSHIIGAVLSQSGSFYYTLNDNENWPVYPEFEGKLLTDIKKSPKLPIKFYLDVGLYDLGLGRVGVNRQLKDILELKGYKVFYKEYKGGHSHLNWRHTLASGLVAILSDVDTINTL